MKHVTKSLLILASGLVMASCSEEELDSILGEDGSAMAEVYVEAEGQFLNLYNRIDEALRDSVLVNTGTTTMDQAQVTLTTDSLVINFGTTNKLCADGKQRKGKIIAQRNGDFINTANASMSVLLVGFHVDDEPIAGSIVMRNNGLNGNNEPTFSVDTAFVDINGDYQFATSKNLTFISGFGTLYNTDDDSYSISGVASGSSVPDNGTYTASIGSTDPLIYDRACAYRMVSGTVDLDIVADSTYGLSVDFLASDGCGNLVRVIQDNGAFITLPFSGF